MLGESTAIKQVFDMIRRVADTEAGALICGESGTGKELVARALHRESKRAKGPFVGVNCASLPASLLESELFGHTKGAFTGATGARVGLLCEANGGTLLLDEVGEMPLEMQTKLLRALQERRVRPIGANHEVVFDAWVISATKRDLEADVEDGRFREDLFYRINVVRIDVPPLRVRGTDILLLAQTFLLRAADNAGKPVKGISSEAAEKLLAYDWPGNVRELENAMRRAVALTRYENVVVDDLPPKIRDFKSTHLSFDSDDLSSFVLLEELEKRYIVSVLKAAGGNKTAAARVLGIERRTLYRKLERYGIKDDAFKAS
ncbi:MAG: sigma-54-dependent Fis family transcriptional regulator [Deltaproteobacteria bacterium]|nr:sigma-54-dependent Fis family transcriptional regulator [Deltaproteobacteria bacterium]